MILDEQRVAQWSELGGGTNGRGRDNGAGHAGAGAASAAGTGGVLLDSLPLVSSDFSCCNRSAAASPTADGAAAALAKGELVRQALLALAGGAGPTSITPGGGTVVIGGGGPAAHFEGLASRALGLPASEPLLDAIFDGGQHIVSSELFNIE